MHVIGTGQNPLPASEHGDLPSVLKAIYLQQKFADFVVAQQGGSDTELYAAFDAFKKAHQSQRPSPDWFSEPTRLEMFEAVL